MSDGRSAKRDLSLAPVPSIELIFTREFEAVLIVNWSRARARELEQIIS